MINLTILLLLWQIKLQQWNILGEFQQQQTFQSISITGFIVHYHSANENGFLFFSSGYCIVCALLTEKTLFSFKSILVWIEGEIMFQGLTKVIVKDTDGYSISKIDFPILHLVLLG